MIEKQIKLFSIGLYLLLSLLIVVSSVSAQSFEPVFRWTKRFQSGEEIESKVHVGAESFTFLRSRTTNINQDTFERLLMPNYHRRSKGPVVEKIQARFKELGYYRGPVDGDFGDGTERAVKLFQKANGLNVDGEVGLQTWKALFPQANIPKPAISQLKILSGRGLIIGYDVSKLLRLEETWKGDRPSAWKKIEFVQIQSYPSKYWLNFIKQAISRGLIEYEVIEYEGESYASLTFKQVGPSSLQFGKRSLEFSDEFYEYMTICKEFKSRKGGTDQFVILVHEPHGLLAGQYQLIPGLKAFLETNSQYNFRFLVEGYFEKETEYISTKPTLDQFSKDVSKETQVISLLGNFLIDGPFAYRLLYDPDLPALAIDDPEIIKMTPREPVFRDLLEHQKVFAEILSKLDRLPQEQTTKAQQMLGLLRYYVQADVQDLEGQSVIDHCLQMTQLYDALSNQLRSFRNQDFTEESSFLKNQAQSYRTHVKILEYALKRDATMARNIASHFKSKYTERIPIVFIGNFHTHGIIDRLPKEIGYVVIEPQVSPLSLTPPKKDRDNFNDALKPETRPSYLIKLGGSLKLGVAPLRKELPYYESFLKRESSRIKSQRNTFKASSPLMPDITSKINNALELNGILTSAQAIFAGGGDMPPPPFQGAFASFSYGPGGENPKMIFYDREEENWKRSDRLNYLKKILLILPYEKVKKETRKGSFYHGRETNRTFFWIFDPKTLTFYLYEWKEGMDVFNLLPLPKVEDEEETTIHLRLSIRELMDYEEEEVDG